MKMLSKVGFILLGVATLAVSCSKDDMFIERNIDTSWEIDEAIVNNDIRTAIGYDPRFNYLNLLPKQVELNLQSFGNFFLTSPQVVNGKLNVALNKSAQKAINVALEYAPELFDPIKEKYDGYQLGDKNTFTLQEASKEIAVGEQETSFSFEGSFSEPKKLVVPYRLKVQGDDELKIGSDQLFVVVKPDQVLNKTIWKSDVYEASQALQDIFEKTKKEHQKNLYLGFFGDLQNTFSVGTAFDKSGVTFKMKNAQFEETCTFGTEKGKVTFNNPRLESGYWGYCKYMEELTQSISNHAPYTVEKISENKVKLASEQDSDFWFYLSK